MKRIVREWKRAVTCWMLLALVLLCFTGCGKEENDSLETLSLEESRTEEERTGEVQEQKDNAEPDEDEGTDSGQQAEGMTEKGIFVYVCGAVHLPGVYELDVGARIYEAISLAGGMTDEAAEEYVNQAQMLSDGEQVYIPTETEVKDEKPGVFPNLEKSRNDRTDGADNSKVNINTASEEELKTLSGIGDTRAKSILEYRESNGGFRVIEDLMKVDGIKEGVFDQIKDRITVNTGS